MSIYDEMQQVAQEILGDTDFKQGETVLIRLTPGAGPVDDPGPATETRFGLDGAMRGVKWTFVQAGLALASDLQLTHSVNPDVTPEPGDFVEGDGIRYLVHQVIARPAVGVPVAYTLILRR